MPPSRMTPEQCATKPPRQTRINAPRTAASRYPDLLRWMIGRALPPEPPRPSSGFAHSNARIVFVISCSMLAGLFPAVHLPAFVGPNRRAITRSRCLLRQHPDTIEPAALVGVKVSVLEIGSC